MRCAGCHRVRAALGTISAARSSSVRPATTSGIVRVRGLKGKLPIRNRRVITSKRILNLSLPFTESLPAVQT